MSDHNLNMFFLLDRAIQLNVVQISISKMGNVLVGIFEISA